MKQFFTLILLISYFLVNGQTQELSKLKIVQKELKQKISTLKDSLVLVNENIDSLSKSIEKNEIEKRLANLSDKEYIGITKEDAILREKPFVNSKMLRRINEKSKVVIKDYVNNFYEICLGEECGFIHYFYIEETKETNLLKEGSSTKVEDFIAQNEDLENRQNSEDKNDYAMLTSIGGPYKFPSSESYKISNFATNKVEVLSYSNDFFKIKDSTNKIAYVKSYGLESYGLEKDYYFINKLKNKLNEEVLKKAKSKNQDILIRGVNVSKINSAGGVNVSLEWLYLNEDKEIKYIEFTLLPYNDVSDLQRSEIGNSSQFTGRATGPVKASDDFKTYYWENAWYNSTISCVKLIKVKVTYMDGSSYIYVNELHKILDENFSNNCK